MKEQLKEAGLTENEAKVYLSLLQLGPSHAGVISRKSGLHRRVIYDCISMLEEKGLISFITENNVKLFKPANPRMILELIKEKENKISEVIPELETMFFSKKEKEDISFFRGKNALKTVMEDEILEKKEILIIGASPLAYDILQFYFKWFDKRRVENKIRTKIIFSKTERKLTHQDLPLSDQIDYKSCVLKNQRIENRRFLTIPYSEIRFLPEKYSSPFAVNIYGDKVALILWSKENPFAVVIKNKEISEGYRKHFELMWKNARLDRK